MDPTFRGLLTEREAALENHLRLWLEGLPSGVQDTDAWPRIERLLRSLGWRNTPL
ncbi:MAG: hypothetical protein HY319_26015 [Armatimonadetes bacterium]|nr:hypothetical protein [Armatimonadota bacterium]